MICSVLQEGDSALNAVAVFPQLALPNREYLPSQRLKLCRLSSVAHHSGASLGLPKLRVGFRSHQAVATVVHVPEASVYEDDFLAAGENDVRATRKF